ncbi:MAG: hemerythrin family protein [Pseudoflavonifractor capillosus]|uniref:bacteriohemerythrin n=1 Tax=Pseudoflavonifractor capillosus TaxID=106588 RepID=UPI0023F98F1F|nr:hemerythrin family protein [Pseudoflavonifractor capillosus]MCI5928827.1 hemerythrin family protein [Pseudoflavonifractor capillosus]MDY4660311.1 hemerythrin family protein [Pseudoflavonifractor capillosus]
MRYEVTKELVTGNTLIDSEHRRLFDAVNELMDACAQGQGRGQIQKTVDFLSAYVVKHFQDEERLQTQSKYPGYPAHKTFHDGYRRQLGDTARSLLQEGPTVKALSDLNRVIGVLVSHIRTEDKRLARYIQEQGG